MPESLWLNQCHKRKNNLRIFFLIAAFCIAAGALILSKGAILPGHGTEQTSSAAVFKNASVPEKGKFISEKAASEIKSIISDASTTKNIIDEPDPPTGGKINDSAGLPAGEGVRKAAFETIDLCNVPCRLSDRSKPSILLSLTLFFPQNRTLMREIFAKRNELKVMVQKTLSKKFLSEIVVCSLRKDVTNNINAILESGSVIDIEFKELKIDKVD
jgi:hypothetical protein